MIKIVGVRFRNAGKVYYFDPKDLQLRMGDHVIAETSKGPEYGSISTCVKMVDEDLVQQPLRSILRRATPEDEDRMDSLRVKEKEALRVCREKAREHELEMKMVDAEYSFDGSKVLFYFTADGRVDFRNLVKDLAGVFHVRIELRQIGVRDETRMLGGIGSCGRELCCATFLRDFEPVSIKMAKEQNLSLNPAKISGTCGRLMCCLKNEEATYEYLNARMPKMGEEAITADGQSGKVIELDVLRQRVRVLFEEGDTKEIEVFPVSELTFKPRKKKDPSQQGKKNRPEKGEKSEKGEKAGKGEKPEKGERDGKGEKAERSEKPEDPGAERERGDEERSDAQRTEAQRGDLQREDTQRRKDLPEGMSADTAYSQDAAQEADASRKPEKGAQPEKQGRKDRPSRRDGAGRKSDAGHRDARKGEPGRRDGAGRKGGEESRDAAGRKGGEESRDAAGRKADADSRDRQDRKRTRRKPQGRAAADPAGEGQSAPRPDRRESGMNSDGKSHTQKTPSGSGDEKGGGKKHRRFRPRRTEGRTENPAE